MNVTLYQDLERLPPFNPDLEGQPPPIVLEFRALLERAHGVLFSSPEYAHGMPGVLKNALDWIVGSGELSAKRVVLLNTSPRAVHAHAQLVEVLETMDAWLEHDLFVSVNLLGGGLSAHDIAAHPEHSSALRTLLERMSQLLKSADTSS